jgi:thiol-disulfide isomerase/thioredoxin
LGSTPPDPRRRRGGTRRVFFISLAVVLVLAAAGAMLVRSRSNPRDTNGGHKSVAGIVLQGFGTRTTVDLAAYRGHPIVINYWASWCTLCIAEMPGFQKAYERVGSTVAFVGVDVLDQLEAAKVFRTQTGVHYTLATDRDASVFKRLGGALGMPTTFFVDRDGFVVERFVGPLTSSALDKRLRKHFGV